MKDVVVKEAARLLEKRELLNTQIQTVAGHRRYEIVLCNPRSPGCDSYDRQFAKVEGEVIIPVIIADKQRQIAEIEKRLLELGVTW